MRREGLPVDEVPPETLRAMISQMFQERGIDFGPDTGVVPANAPATEEEYLDLIEDSLVVFFNDPDEEVDATYLEWLDAQRVKHHRGRLVPVFHRMVAHTGPLNPSDREVRALTLGLDALAQFFKSQKRAIAQRYPPDLIVLPQTITDRIASTVQVADPGGEGKTLSIDVSLPAPEHLTRNA